MEELKLPEGRFSELIVALIKLAALQVRLGTIATEVAWTFHSRSFSQLAQGCNRQSPRRIDAAARAIELKLIAGHE